MLALSVGACGFATSPGKIVGIGTTTENVADLKLDDNFCTNAASKFYIGSQWCFKIKVESECGQGSDSFRIADSGLFDVCAWIDGTCTLAGVSYACDASCLPSGESIPTDPADDTSDTTDDSSTGSTTTSVTCSNHVVLDSNAPNGIFYTQEVCTSTTVHTGRRLSDTSTCKSTVTNQYTNANGNVVTVSDSCSWHMVENAVTGKWEKTCVCTTVTSEALGSGSGNTDLPTCQDETANIWGERRKR